MRRYLSRLILIIVLSIIETNSPRKERICASLSWEGSESSISVFVSFFKSNRKSSKSFFKIFYPFMDRAKNTVTLSF